MRCIVAALLMTLSVGCCSPEDPRLKKQLSTAYEEIGEVRGENLVLVEYIN